MRDRCDHHPHPRRCPVVGGVLIQPTFGAIYARSAFAQRLTDPTGSCHVSASAAAGILSAGLATFAVIIVLVGGGSAPARP